MRINHFLLAVSVMLAMAFTYSCSNSDEKDEKHYNAKIYSANIYYNTNGCDVTSDIVFPLPYATMESYIFLYPYITMEPRGYFLNEMAKSEFSADICSYNINKLREFDDYEHRVSLALYESKAEWCLNLLERLSLTPGGTSEHVYNPEEAKLYGSERYYCVVNSTQDFFSGKIAEMKDWLKSANTPFYNDINSEIFVEGNSKFLGFYKVNGQEYYIFVGEK